MPRTPIITTPLELYLALSTRFDQHTWANLTYAPDDPISRNSYVFSEKDNFKPGARLTLRQKPYLKIRLAEDYLLSCYLRDLLFKMIKDECFTGVEQIFWDELNQEAEVLAHCRLHKLKLLSA